jgi:hypothetical protein
LRTLDIKVNIQKKGVSNKGCQHKDKKNQRRQHKYKEDVKGKKQRKEVTKQIQSLEFTLGGTLGNLSLYNFLFTAQTQPTLQPINKALLEVLLAQDMMLSYFVILHWKYEKCSLG